MNVLSDLVDKGHVVEPIASSLFNCAVALVPKTMTPDKAFVATLAPLPIIVRAYCINTTGSTTKEDVIPT